MMDEICGNDFKRCFTSTIIKLCTDELLDFPPIAVLFCRSTDDYRFCLSSLC